MVLESFTLWSSETIVVGTDIPTPTAFEIFTIFDSGTLSNTTNLPGLDVTINYEDVVPNITAGLPPWSITCLVENLDSNDNPSLIAQQFQPWRNLEQSMHRIVRLSPDISDIAFGLDNSIFLGKELCRISPNAGRLRSGNFRIRIVGFDPDPTGPNKLVSLKLSGNGERYSV